MVTTTMASLRNRWAMKRSPLPSGAVESSTRQTASTSAIAPVAVSFSRSPSNVRGLWIPGVSTKTICDSGRCSTPRTSVRVVCGLSDTIVTLVPRIEFNSVDLPTLGRPTNVQKPERNAASSVIEQAW